MYGKARKKMSMAQKVFIINFMEENKEVMNNRFKSDCTTAKKIAKWKELSEKLNSLGGAHKSTEKWIKCWSDMKVDLKKKLNTNRDPKKETGPKELEERLSALMKPHSIIGLDVPLSNMYSKYTSTTETPTLSNPDSPSVSSPIAGPSSPSPESPQQAQEDIDRPETEGSNIDEPSCSSDAALLQPTNSEDVAYQLHRIAQELASAKEVKKEKNDIWKCHNELLKRQLELEEKKIALMENFFDFFTR